MLILLLNSSMQNRFCLSFVFIFLSFFLIFSEERVIIGRSVDERPINLYKFGDGNQILVIIAGIHGNEENTSKTAEFILNELIQKKNKVPKNKSLWIIPRLNPDGLLKDRRLNDNDVDLNRNFATDNWQPLIYFSNNIFSAGSKPFSEPETQAIQRLFEPLRNSKSIVVLSLHSAGDAIIPGNEQYYNTQFASIVYENSDYLFDNIGYNTSGDMTGWLSDRLGIAALTIEFKSKIDLDIKNVKRMIKGILNIDITKAVYIESNKDMEKRYKNIDKIIKELPKDVISKIKKSKKSEDNFLSHLKAIPRNSEELLLLVNKKNLLPKDYIPNDLVNLDNSYFKSNKNSYQLRRIILNDLRDMFSDSNNDDVSLSIVSAFRSYETQVVVYNGWVKQYGAEYASTISAKPGASQHQLGTVIDFNSLEESFEKTKEGVWLKYNAFKYGFVMSFPKGLENITGYSYEPWHFRYIGKEAAYLVHNFFNENLELFLKWYWEINNNY